MLRLGKYTRFKGKYITQFYHFNCGISMLSKVRSEVKMVDNINQIDGLENVADKDLLTLKEAIHVINEERKAKSNKKTSLVKKEAGNTYCETKKKKITYP